MTLQRTPLFEAHQRAGARLVDFGGWEMPVQYSGIMDEHLCVRRNAGIFDISHMGEVEVSGPAAAAFLNRVLTNDIGKLTVGLGQYTLLCNERGGTVDDLYAYRTGETDYLLVINASRIAADVAWLRRQWEVFPTQGDVALQDRSSALAAVALQGPKSPGLVETLFPRPATEGMPVARPGELAKNQIARFDFDGRPAWVSRTGYTGEDGFEVVCANDVITPLWDRALQLGHPFCLQPIGLGARDTLRTEMGYPLYGHELDEETTPIEAGVGFFVALDKGDFNGREVMAEQKANGTKRKLIAFKMTGKSAPPRPHYPIVANGAKIGETTSGTLSPSLNTGIGMGFVPAEFARPDTAIEIEIRGKTYPAVVARKPLYRRQ